MPVGQPAIDTIYKHLKNNTNVNLDKNDDDDNDYNHSNYNSIEAKTRKLVNHSVCQGWKNRIKTK